MQYIFLVRFGFSFSRDPPNCRCFCVQSNCTVLWKECWNVSSQIWKPCFNPSLWQSDEVLAVCLGPPVLLLLFFHWHHLSTFPTSSPLFSSPLSQTREKRSARPVCRSSGCRETIEHRRVALAPEQERWWWGRWRSQQMAPASAKSPRQTVSPSLVVYFFYFLYLCVNLFLTTQVNKEPIFIYSDVLIYNCKTQNVGRKKEKNRIPNLMNSKQ